MSARYAPWYLRSWIFVALIVAPFVVFRETFDLTYPVWVRWIGIAVPFLVGGALVIKPDLATMKNLSLARLLGAVMVTAAALGVYQLLQFSPE